jgi:hypothetical protein
MRASARQFRADLSGSERMTSLGLMRTKAPHMQGFWLAYRMERAGIEPATSGLQSRRSPS